MVKYGLSKEMNKDIKEGLTIEDALAEIGFGRFQVFAIMILGFILFNDSSEVVMLVFIDPILRCEWHLNMGDFTVLTAGVFIGIIFGSCVFGKFSDMFGRKPILLVGIFGITYFGMATAVAPTFVWFVILRTFVGIFIGCNNSIISAYCTELMPQKHRSTGNLSLEIFWTLSPYVHCILVMFVVPKYGWRLWLFIIALPMFIAIPLILWMPESPRYLLTKNNVKEAIDNVNRIAFINNEKVISKLQIPNQSTSNLLDIFHVKYRLTRFLVFYIWFLIGLSNYGFLQTAIINNIPHQCLQYPRQRSNPQRYSNGSIDNSCCYRYSWSNFQTILISSIGETSISMFMVIFGRYFPRKVILFVLVFITMTVFLLINLCLTPFQLGILMFFGRGSAACLFSMNFLYNAEVYPTTIRAYALGIGCSFARIGSIIAQILFNHVMINVSFLWGSMAFFGLNFLGLICIIFLPYETKEMSLREGLEDYIESNNPIYTRNQVNYGTNKS